MQQARYKSSEQILLRGVRTVLRQSPMYDRVNGHIYGKQQDGIGRADNGNSIFPFTYIIVGESNVTPQYYSQAHTENIAVTFHLYHRSESIAIEDEARALLDELQYHAELFPQMEHYEVVKARIDTKQTITDVDLETMHGILRITYTIKHLTRR